MVHVDRNEKSKQGKTELRGAPPLSAVNMTGNTELRIIKCSIWGGCPLGREGPES